MGSRADRRRPRGARLVLAGLLVVATTWSAASGAEPLSSVVVTGGCPSQTELDAALTARRLPEGAGAFKLVLAGLTDGANVVLIRLPAETVLTRRVTSSDCRALADAAAVIVEGYFVELAAQGPAPSAPLAPKNVASFEAAPAAATTSAAAPPAPAPPPATTPVAAAAAPAPRPPGPARAATETPPAATRSPRFSIALTGGAEVYIDRGVAAAGQLGLGLGVSSVLELEAHAVVTTSTTSGAAPDRVSRVERRAAVRALGWVGGTPSLAPFGGIGAAFTSVEALDVTTGSSETVWSPVLEAGLALRQPVSSSIALDGELGCHVLLTRESYRVEPDGEIGKGPRFACALLAGGSWSSR